jgi:hypothetical protein
MELKNNDKIPVTMFVEDLETASLLIKLAREQNITAYKNEDIEKALISKSATAFENNKTHAYIEDLAKSLNDKKTKNEKSSNLTNEHFIKLLKSKLGD